MEDAKKNSVTLISFPYAGGTKHSYRFLKTYLSKNIVYHPFEIPGHGSRIKEDLLTNIDEIVDDMYLQVENLITGSYAFYGHSMGATVAYLLTKKILLNGFQGPVHLFISGTDGPSAPRREQAHHLLSKKEFIEKIQRYGGMPQEIITNKELMNFFEPILRADFQAIETYNYTKAEPFNLPITIMTGDLENLIDEDIAKWQEETTVIIKTYKFPGNHFFIFDNQREISELIENTIKKN